MKYLSTYSAGESKYDTLAQAMAECVQRSGKFPPDTSLKLPRFFPHQLRHVVRDRAPSKLFELYFYTAIKIDKIKSDEDVKFHEFYNY